MTLKMRQLFLRAQHGDESAREKLIRRYRNYVAGVCFRECNRRLAWENDEELSVGLIALNEAISSYDISSGAKFSTFAYMVIKRRLIDYFRSQSRLENHMVLTPLELEGEQAAEVIAKSMKIYCEASAGENLSYIVDKYKQKLRIFNIDIYELPGIVPKQREKFQSLYLAARSLAMDKKMVDYLMNCGQLPVKELCQSTGLSRKIVEKRRKLIIALAVILLDPQLATLSDYAV
jgi:RNA polymerase sigma factor